MIEDLVELSLSAVTSVSFSSLVFQNFVLKNNYIAITVTSNYVHQIRELYHSLMTNGLRYDLEVSRVSQEN